MAKNAVMVFYEGDGKIRAEAAIHDNKAKPDPSNYSNNVPGYFLDDPYEGELMAFLMTLFGDWKDPHEIDRIWQLKRTKLKPIQYQTPVGALTVAQGHWFSAHEQWKYLVLPYIDVPVARQIFINGETIRICL